MGQQQSNSTIVPDIPNLPDLKKAVQAAGNKLVVIFFYRGVGITCWVMMAHMDKLSQEFPNVVFLKAYPHSDVAAEYQVTYSFTPKFIKNGQMVDEFLGVPPSSESDLRIKITKHQ